MSDNSGVSYPIRAFQMSDSRLQIHSLTSCQLTCSAVNVPRVSEPTEAADQTCSSSHSHHISAQASGSPKPMPRCMAVMASQDQSSIGDREPTAWQIRWRFRPVRQEIYAVMHLQVFRALAKEAQVMKPLVNPGACLLPKIAPQEFNIPSPCPGETSLYVLSPII